MKRTLYAVALLLMSACRPDVSDDSCDQASLAALGAIDTAGACSDAISAAPDDPSVESLTNCARLHEEAIARTQATENACASQVEVVQNIREARRNLQRTASLLDARLRHINGRD